ncbi:MAG: DUF2115 domain-containing protein [Methanomicrobiaceae archaeon]|nr:DUF2115 domain-containing protein [Methanomicrobiaceae archaeon]
MAEEGFKGDCERLGNLKTRGELGREIAAVVSGYSARDLKKMQMNFSGSLAGIDSKYKKKLEKMITGHLHETWEDIRLMNQQGSFSPMKDLLPEDAGGYWKMVSLQCSEGDLSVRLRFLKFLLAGFCMFVKKIPPHPVGMPFPGGDSVQLIDGIYYCPVRIKAGDVDSALCPFCPAQQTPESGYLKPPVKGSEHRRQEYLRNTFDFHHYNG